MTAAEADRLISGLESGVWQALVVFLRVAPVMALVPGFSEHSVPMRIRMALALAMTAVVAPALPPVGDSGGLHVFLSVLATETACGLLLGLGLRTFILGLQTAGAIAAQATSLSQVFGGAGVEPLPAFGHILVMGGIALAMMLGLHVRVAEFLIGSYAFLPARAFPDPAGAAQWGLDRVAEAFALAMQLAMPFLVVSVIYNLTLGVINRAMPQLMVALVGTPALTAGGLILLALLAPRMVELWHDALAAFLADPAAPLP